jgi:mRNA-degrading endonuclease YafQ of YafQ-DinJ toxin-antitoxin module
MTWRLGLVSDTLALVCGDCFMPDIIEKLIKAGELPPELRGDLDVETTVLVSVRRLTENRFTEAFEDGVLDAEKATDHVPFRPAHDVIEELAAPVKDDREVFEAIRRLASKAGPGDKTAVIHTLDLFVENPFDPSLGNHALAGSLMGKRAFAVAGDLCVVFAERGNYQDGTLLDVGGRSSDYRR